MNMKVIYVLTLVILIPCCSFFAWDDWRHGTHWTTFYWAMLIAWNARTLWKARWVWGIKS